MLTFRAVACAAHFEWLELNCRAEGVLERAERGSQFSRYKTFAILTVPAGVDLAVPRELLERAESGCSITNSLRGSRSLEVQVLIADR
jgi:hypothetical protein